MSVEKGSLRRDLFYPPFSVLDARAGWWAKRKKKWLELGIESELGRPDTFKSMVSAYKNLHGIDKEISIEDVPAWAKNSIFDPVLCDILYRWFTPKGGLIFDPFAGGSVRGIVAAKLGYKYTGFDIRQEQVDANYIQAKSLLKKGEPTPNWKVADACARSIYPKFRGPADLIFTCPPYGDLEVYSDDPKDISTLPYDTFAGAMKHSIKQAASRLKDNRFAIYVVSDIRDKHGHYVGLPDMVRAAGVAAGMQIYSEMILMTPLGTVPVRARRLFDVSRKISRCHQNVILFVKGDPAQARKEIGNVPVGDPLA